MENKRPKGVIIFGILILLGAALQIKGLSIASYNFLFGPLPKTIIIFRFVITVMMLILGIVTAIGIILRKEIFRKLVLLIGYYILYNYLIEGPLIVYRNLPKYINQIIVAAGAPLEPRVYIILWTPIIVSFLIEFVFGLSLVYYFSRPKIKEKFK